MLLFGYGEIHVRNDTPPETLNTGKLEKDLVRKSGEDKITRSHSSGVYPRRRYRRIGLVWDLAGNYATGFHFAPHKNRSVPLFGKCDIRIDNNTTENPVCSERRHICCC